MTKTTALLSALAVGTLLGLSGASYGMGPGMGHMGLGPGGHMMMMGEGPAMMLPLILKHANLTPDQKNQVQKIIAADRQPLRARFDQLRAANSALADQLFAPGNVQASDLAPQVQRIVQLRQQLLEQGLKTALAIRAVLTPDQLTKAAALKNQIEQLQTQMRALFEGD